MLRQLQYTISVGDEQRSSLFLGKCYKNEGCVVVCVCGHMFSVMQTCDPSLIFATCT